MKIRSLFIALLFVLFTSAGIMAEELAELSPSKITGYYHSEENDILMLANGKLYLVEEDSSGLLSDPISFTAYGDADEFVVEGNQEYVLFSRQKDKGMTENGGAYYAVYEDYIGTEENGFQEGKHVKYGSLIFDNDYEVFEKDPLKTFFGDAFGDVINDRMEGSGFDTPEDALGAYIEGLKANDISAMVAAFAVETYAENYSLVKMVERIRSYISSIPYLPNISGYSTQLNTEARRAEIVDSIRKQYLVMQESKTAVGEYAYTPIPLNDTYDSASEMIEDLFAADDTAYLGTIEFNKDYYDPGSISDNYSSENNRENLKKQMAVYGAEDIVSVVAKFYSNGAPFVIMADAVKYNNKWYLNSMGGNIGAIAGVSSYNAGLVPLRNEEWSDAAEFFGE